MKNYKMEILKCKKICIQTTASADSHLFAITFISYGMMRIAGSDVVTSKKMAKYRTDCIRR